VPVKIRLRVVGKRKQHTYRIVAIESRNPRDGKYLEQLGWYNPRSKELQIDEEGIKRWQEKGAVLTGAVKALLKRIKGGAAASPGAKGNTETSTEKSTKKNSEGSTDTGKSEEVSDAEGTDNVHSEVSGGST